MTQVWRRSVPQAGTARILADIKLEIAPLRLPVELERFWQLVDPRTITVAPYPHPTDADFALDSWKSHRDEFPGMTPRLLFPLAYESHGFLLVELSDGDSQGGAVLEWGYAGSPFYLRFAAVSAYVELLATMIECDEFTRHEVENRSWIEFDPERRWEGAQAARLTAAQPLPGLGAAREIDEDVRHWPAHWLASNGLNAETSSPRGASSTVADLLFGTAAGSAVSGTIQARVTSLAGSGAGCRVAVDDGTGVLDLWCPAAVCTYGRGSVASLSSTSSCSPTQPWFRIGAPSIAKSRIAPWHTTLKAHNRRRCTCMRRRFSLRRRPRRRQLDLSTERP